MLNLKVFRGLLCNLLVVIGLCIHSSLFALEATEWIEKSDKILRGNSNHMQVSILVKTLTWERVYKMDSWMKGTDHSFVRVLEPLRVKGQGFLKIETRLWNYLPTAERTVLIPPSLMLEDFMGSDFSNDDFVKMSYVTRDYTHKLAGEDTINGEAAYVFELLPKPAAPVVYGKLKSWLRVKDAAPLKTEFYDERMQHIRTLVYSDFKTFNDREFPTTWRMLNHLEKGNETTVTVHSAEFNIPLDADIFTKRNLENP